LFISLHCACVCVMNDRQICCGWQWQRMGSTSSHFKE
jgi:hypothetical protein